VPGVSTSFTARVVDYSFISPLTIVWDFGDGSAPVTDFTPTFYQSQRMVQSTIFHEFPALSDCHVTFSATSGAGFSSATFFRVQQGASIVFMNCTQCYPAFVNQFAVFVVQMSSLAGLSHIIYEFGDGAMLTGTVTTVSHIYYTLGTFSVTATVYLTGGGPSSSQSVSVLVAPPPSLYDITVSPALSVTDPSIVTPGWIYVRALSPVTFVTTLLDPGLLSLDVKLPFGIGVIPDLYYVSDTMLTYSYTATPLSAVVPTEPFAMQVYVRSNTVYPPWSFNFSIVPVASPTAASGLRYNAANGMLSFEFNNPSLLTLQYIFDYGDGSPSSSGTVNTGNGTLYSGVHYYTTIGSVTATATLQDGLGTSLSLATDPCASGGCFSSNADPRVPCIGVWASVENCVPVSYKAAPTECP